DQARPGARTDRRPIDHFAGQTTGSDRAGYSKRRRHHWPQVRVAPVFVTGRGKAPLSEAVDGGTSQSGQPCGGAIRTSALERLELRQVAIRAGDDGAHTVATSSRIQS